jgi:hypothetical protein
MSVPRLSPCSSWLTFLPACGRPLPVRAFAHSARALCARPVRTLPDSRGTARMSQGGGGGRKIGGDPENERLYKELRSKVDELYGSAENVSIVSRADDTVDFRVMRPSSAKEYRMAWMTVGSIAALTALSFAAFAFLSQTGAIHSGTNRTFEAPTYKTRTYVNPYSLLEQDEILLREDAPIMK